MRQLYAELVPVSGKGNHVVLDMTVRRLRFKGNAACLIGLLKTLRPAHLSVATREDVKLKIWI